MKLRNVSNWYKNNDGSRSLLESVVANEVLAAMQDWVKATKNKDLKCVLIGGLALSYHSKPRHTQDVDILFMSDADIPDEVTGFKRIRPHAFQHNTTHVEIEVITPELIKSDNDISQQVFDTSFEDSGIKVASKSAIVALKLNANRTGARGRQDETDIMSLIELGDIDLTPFNLSKECLDKYEQLCSEIDK